ncbi:MAG: TerB family tellurite resistance protein [Gammaproteobacteria bacterium]|nr:TerB family tellurite resistance protein [Gammaproteobacteria bacterium]
MKFLIDTLFKAIDIKEQTVDREHLLQVSTTTLLLEVVRADFEVQESEIEKLHELLRRQFQLNLEELEQIVAEAQDKADHLVSLQHITRQLNQQFSETEKTRVIEMMWEIVFADGNLDHYEEHLIRQVAELLYLPHAAFIQARHKAEPAVM